MLMLLAGVGLCQDAEHVKKKVLASVAKIENYSAAIVKGRAIYRGRLKGIAHVQFRGNKMWKELDNVATADETEKRRIISNKDVMGTSNFLYTAAFDGEVVRVWPADPPLHRADREKCSRSIFRLCFPTKTLDLYGRS